MSRDAAGVQAQAKPLLGDRFDAIMHVVGIAWQIGVQLVTSYPVPITEDLLREITKRIVENFDPEKVILFGSRSTTAARADSDVDLLVIMEASGSPIQRAVEVKRVCRPRFVSMDVLVKTPDEVETRLDQGSFFLRQILEQGKVLYERQS